MKTNKVLTVFVYLLMLLPLICFALVYNSLPAEVALHFGLDGKPDRYGSKDEMIFVQVLLFVVSLGSYLLISNLDKIDPKKAASMSKGATKKMAVAIVFLLTAISLLTIMTSIDSEFNIERILLPLMGLFFAYMGNLMYSIKPNYFVGIRTPWALEDEDTWRKTHMLAGKLWFAGGILVCIAGLLLPMEVALISMISILIIICMVPAVFSYRYYKQHKAKQ